MKHASSLAHRRRSCIFVFRSGRGSAPPVVEGCMGLGTWNQHRRLRLADKPLPDPSIYAMTMSSPLAA